MSFMFGFKYENFVQSPLNYTGGKARLLPQLLPLFPRNIDLFVDLFCGGGCVGLNSKAKELILNDKNKNLMEILRLFKSLDLSEILAGVEKIIADFKLSNSSKFGYEFYGCNSKKGLSSYNKSGFLNLKNAYNKDKDALKLFVLIIFSFNNQMRFNKNGEFNLPCGKRDFNAKMQEKLKNFIFALKDKKAQLENKDFRDFDLKILNKNSLVYIDPPYLLATASYNENGAWSKDDEKDLLEFMQLLNAKNIKFALSNVLLHKGKKHTMLKAWLEKNQFKTHFLNFSYKNCNYQTKREESKELLVCSYGV